MYNPLEVAACRASSASWRLAVSDYESSPGTSPLVIKVDPFVRGPVFIQELSQQGPIEEDVLIKSSGTNAP